MSKKEHPKVLMALGRQETALKALQEARARVSELEKDYANLVSAVHVARFEADSTMPQCRLVMVRRGGKEEGACKVVILRKTPTGILVVRRVGTAPGDEIRFSYDANRSEYFQIRKPSAWGTYSYVLRDVPAEYLPAN